MDGTRFAPRLTVRLFCLFDAPCLARFCPPDNNKSIIACVARKIQQGIGGVDLFALRNDNEPIG